VRQCDVNGTEKVKQCLESASVVNLFGSTKDHGKSSWWSNEHQL